MKKRLFIYFLLNVVVSFLLSFIINILPNEAPDILSSKWYHLIIETINIITILLYIGIIYELYKTKVSYKLVILFIFILTIIPYHIAFFSTNLYYDLYAQEAKLEIVEMHKSSFEVILEGASEVPSMFQYNPFKNLLRELNFVYYSTIKDKYILNFINYLFRQPFFLLLCFSKIILFKRLKLSKILSIFFPINYILLIDKYELPKSWKYLLLLPLVNIYFKYKINKEITKEFNLSNVNALGMVLLPFIYYPKIVFNK